MSAAPRKVKNATMPPPIALQSSKAGSRSGGAKRKVPAASTGGDGLNGGATVEVVKKKQNRLVAPDKSLRGALSFDCDTQRLLRMLHSDINSSGSTEEGGEVKQKKPKPLSTGESLESFVVGHKVDIFSKAGMNSGRIVRYDARKDQHLISFGEACGQRKWMTLREESARISLELVWARIDGCPWWPGEVWCHTVKALNDRPYDLEEGKLLVVFYNGNTHGWVSAANAENTMRLMVKENEADMLRRAVGTKAREKPKVEAALVEGKEEQARICELQDQAMAEAAKEGSAAGASKTSTIPKGRPPKGPEWQGRLFKLFSKKVNYPAGGWLTGVVRLYSRISKQMLVVYDDKIKAPEWIDFSKMAVEEITEAEKAEMLRKPKALSMTRGHEYLMCDESKDEGDGDMTRCKNCKTARTTEALVACKRCREEYHPACVDPPWCKPTPSQAATEEWVCPACSCCDGCGKMERELEQDKFLEELRIEGEKVMSCDVCMEKYRKKEYCPSCTRVWNADGGEGFQVKEEDLCMLKCDKPTCPLWVHARCEGLSNEEYDQVTTGKHPTLSKEYFCPGCREDCLKWALKIAQAEDALYLFAEPVTEEIAPTYFEIIRRPMDLTSMLTKLERGEYKCTQMIRDDLELMVRNALIFNPPNSKYWKEALRFYRVVIPRLTARSEKTTICCWGNEIGELLAKRKALSSKPTGQQQQLPAHLLSPGEKYGSPGGLDRGGRSLSSGAAGGGLGFDGGASKGGRSTIRTGMPNVEVKLHKPHDPESFATVTEMILTDQDAYYTSWLDCCLVCGSTGDPSKLLFCMDCGESYHFFCVQAPGHEMDEYAKATWRCVNCKLCEICGVYKEDEEKSLLQCELCDKGHHMSCLQPPLVQAPDDPWYCGSCITECQVCLKPAAANSWSCHPKVCYDCGGFSEKNAEMRLRCSVCLYRWEMKDQHVKMAQCDECHLWVHHSCDGNAEKKSKERGASASHHPGGGAVANGGLGCNGIAEDDEEGEDEKDVDEEEESGSKTESAAAAKKKRKKQDKYVCKRCLGGVKEPTKAPHSRIRAGSGGMELADQHQPVAPPVGPMDLKPMMPHSTYGVSQYPGPGPAYPTMTAYNPYAAHPSLANGFGYGTMPLPAYQPLQQYNAMLHAARSAAGGSYPGRPQAPAPTPAPAPLPEPIPTVVTSSTITTTPSSSAAAGRSASGGSYPGGPPYAPAPTPAPAPLPEPAPTVITSSTPTASSPDGVIDTAATWDWNDSPTQRPSSVPPGIGNHMPFMSTYNGNGDGGGLGEATEETTPAVDTEANDDDGEEETAAPPDFSGPPPMGMSMAMGLGISPALGPMPPPPLPPVPGAPNYLTNPYGAPSPGGYFYPPSSIGVAMGGGGGGGGYNPQAYAPSMYNPALGLAGPPPSLGPPLPKKKKKEMESSYGRKEREPKIKITSKYQGVRYNKDWKKSQAATEGYGKRWQTYWQDVTEKSHSGGIFMTQAEAAWRFDELCIGRGEAPRNFNRNEQVKKAAVRQELQELRDDFGLKAAEYVKKNGDAIIQQQQQQQQATPPSSSSIPSSVKIKKEAAPPKSIDNKPSKQQKAAAEAALAAAAGARGPTPAQYQQLSQQYHRQYQQQYQRQLQSYQKQQQQWLAASSSQPSLSSYPSSSSSVYSAMQTGGVSGGGGGGGGYGDFYGQSSTHKAAVKATKFNKSNRPPGALSWLPEELPDDEEVRKKTEERKKRIRGALLASSSSSAASGGNRGKGGGGAFTVITNTMDVGTTKPLIGWNGLLTPEMEGKLGEWEDPRKCVLCRQASEDVLTGRLLLLEQNKGAWVHSNCGLWSSEACEVEGHLFHVHAARSRSSTLKCRKCHLGGATVGCNSKGCRENYHFLCALATESYFFEDKRVFCKEHRAQGDKETRHSKYGIQELQAADLLEAERMQKVFPADKTEGNSRREALPPPPSNSIEATFRKVTPPPSEQDLFKELILGDGQALRVGSVIVHALGEIMQESPFFHTASYIYPKGFRSTRIFWSAVRPHTRTVWACTIGSKEEEQAQAVVKTPSYLGGPPQASGGPTIVEKTLFRIVAMDNMNKVYEGPSLEALHQELIEDVKLCQLPAIEALRRQCITSPSSGRPKRAPQVCMPRPLDRACTTYGLSPQDFIGVSLPAIRKNIEELPGAAMTALHGVDAKGFESGSGRYRFCYSLPNKDSVNQARRIVVKRQRSVVVEEPHCARVDANQVFHGAAGNMSRKVRIAEEADYEPPPMALKRTTTEGTEAQEGTGGRGGGGGAAELSDHKAEKSVSQQYRDLRSVPFSEKLLVKRSRIHGWGLFAKVPFKENEMVAEYIGEVIRSCLADIREKKYEESGQGSCYLFRLDRFEIVDATYKGNLARFVNHSCSPNCTARICPVESGEKKIIFFAKRAIEAGDELTYNYQFPLEDEKIPCFCGAPSCPGTMN